MRRILLFFLTVVAAGQSFDELKRGFANPPADARIMMRWWWFGPSIGHAEIDRDLNRMKEAGIGGVEIQPVYPLSLEGNYGYLSGRFLDAVGHARRKAGELGLRVDITLGSGWPYGGPEIPVSHAAGRLRIERIPVPARASHVKAPALSDGESLLAYFLNGERIEKLDNVTGKEMPQTVVAFIASRTGMQVKRAAIGAEGFVLDHYDSDALRIHLDTVGKKLAEAFGATPPRAYFSDSLEVFASDWTPKFAEEFRRRRGYDIIPYLPALAGDAGPDTGAVRNDWARTLTELCNENYLRPLAEWTHRHGAVLRSQTYGVPPVTLASQGLVDLPEGEKPHWRAFTPARWAASGAHLTGKTVASSETWTWLHSPAFRATPLDMKAEADLHFLQGINQLVGHGWPASPERAGEPGYRFYAAAVFNHHNPWWIVMPEIGAYLQRVSWILRQGKPSNDVALYLPVADARTRFTAGNVSVDRQFEAGFAVGPVIPQILDAGYNFDFIDDESIERVGIPHPVLVLPPVERMSAAAARKINEYKNRGGIVIACRRTPDKAPGLKDAAPPPLQALVTSDLVSALHTSLVPDIRSVPEIGFIHRKLKDADVYFLVNTSSRTVPADVEFRSGGNRQVWDPVSGGQTEWRNEFEPYESRVVVISNRTASPTPAGRAVRELALRFEGGEWPPYFSGVRTYVARFNAPGGQRVILDFGKGTTVAGEQGNKPGMRAWLDPPVREAALIFVNGQRAGAVWKAPFELDVSRFMKPGMNEIRAEVANTGINRMAGESLPNYRLLNLRFGERFQPQDMDNLQPLPSGITGKPKLVIQD